MWTFWIIWVPFFIGILIFLFCRFCLSKYDWSNHQEKHYTMKVWVFLLYLLWALTPILNWTCFVIILIAFIEDGYGIKGSIKDFFTTNKYVKFLNKEI